MKTIEEVQKELAEVRQQIKDRKFYVSNAQMKTLKKRRQTLISRLVYLTAKQDGKGQQPANESN